MAEGRSMESRTGRTKQRYSETGERLVAGIVPVSSDKNYVLLISSSSRTSWVLPKGGWETDEATEQDAAIREAWEEAGVSVTISYDLGTVDEMRSPSQFTNKAPKARYHFFEATVDQLEEDWPEKDKRTRQWMTFSQASQSLQARPELLEALNRSTMNRL